MFPAKFRSINLPWHSIANVHMSTLRAPHNSGRRINDYPKSLDDFDCSASPHLPTPIGEFFSGSSKRVLANIFSRVRGYHRALWRGRRFGQRLCRIWHVHWDEPYSSCEHRVFQYPPEMIAPPPYQIWGDFLMWMESKDQRLTVVDAQGLIVFANDPSLKKRMLRQWNKFRRNGDGEWYEVIESGNYTEEDTRSPIMHIRTLARKKLQLRLFNIFTRKQYTVPFQKIYKEIEYLGADSPVVYPQDVIETTMCPDFLLFFQIHTPSDILMMVWDVDRNCSKWKTNVSGAICDEEYKLKRLKFGNALVGFLAKCEDRYVYKLLDMGTGSSVQTFPLHEYRNPLSLTEFDCEFTSFVFIVWEPQSFVDQYMQAAPNTYLTAPFNVYSISSGQRLYVLQCPMHYPEDIMDPIIPSFQRTDESERYWLFSCPSLFRDEDDPINTVYVWDVVLQHWTILGSRCVQKEDFTIIYEDQNGRMRMAQLEVDKTNSFEEEENALSQYRWKRLPTVKEARKLQSPRLESVLRSTT